MAATGYTPIQLYYSTTASATPSAGNLAAGELAINTNDGKLYYKDSGGSVQLLASKAGASGTVTSVAMTVPSFLSVSGSPVTSSGTLAVSLSGTALPAANGGTGQVSYSTGDLLYASGSTAISKLAIGTTNYVLTSSGTAPQYVAQSTLAVGSATNLAGGAASQIPYQTGSGATSFISNGTSGQVLTSNGASAPTWQTASGITTGKSIAMAMIFGF